MREAKHNFCKNESEIFAQDEETATIELNTLTK
jgi:hypothetical protein